MLKEWKPIEGYEGLYEVSNLGDVRSIDRTVISKLGIPRRLKSHTLIPSQNNGYLQVQLWKDNKPKTVGVHILVAKAFVEGYAPGLIVNHKDGNKSKNESTNLEWITQQENVQHAIDNNIFSTVPLGEDRYNSILTEEIVRLIKLMKKQGRTLNQVVSTITHMGFLNPYNSIVGVWYGRTWKHVQIEGDVQC